MNLTFRISFFFFLISNAFASFNKDEIKTLADLSLNFVLVNQIQEKNQIYLRGEWPQDVEFTGYINWLGLSPKDKLEDPSVFTTASIINVLLSAYPNGFHSAPQRVRTAALMATNSFADYKLNHGYHFYPKTEISSLSESRGKKIKVHVSRQVRMPGKPFGIKINNGAIVPADVDTTATVHITLNKVLGKKISQEELMEMTRYRDEKRKPYILNKLHGYKNTGAYLTWLQSEPDISIADKGLLKAISDNIDYTFADVDHLYRIPFAKNDIDCVVNINALRALSLNGTKDVPGYKASCQFINKVFFDGKTGSCGIYYPNTYYPHFTATNAILDGTSCLTPSLHRILHDLRSGQKKNGSWKNKANIEIALRIPDPIQTTLYALATYINVAKIRPQLINKDVQESFRRGLTYLRDQFFYDDEGNYRLPEGMFYSAFPPIRNNSAWRSKAYTMAIAFKVFKEADFVLTKR